VVLVQGKKQDELILVRCPVCKGLRGVAQRHSTRNGKTCVDCRSGKVVKKSQFYNYWTVRFTMEEIEEMAKACWG
jgi:hypothetical protein